MMKRFLQAAAVFMVLILMACMALKVDRIPPATVTDLSGGWSDTDSRLVAEEMMTEALSLPWIHQFTQANKRRKPVLIVGEITNLSDEHINVNAFVADIERALISSGQVDIIASKYAQEEIRDERQDQEAAQEVQAGTATRKPSAPSAPSSQALVADFMLRGTVNTVVDAISKRQPRFYQVDLVLISLTDNRPVWTGQKQLKKAVMRPQLRY